MPAPIPLDLFLKQPGIILDVRSPSEYAHAHLPGSHSLPLFTDEERARIGTVYKQKSKEEAIDLGLQLAGPKLFTLVQQAKAYLHRQEGKILCWRGGMRSGFVARLLESIGFQTATLQGGYKSFRRSVIKTLENILIEQPRLYILGGLTGSGKTDVLKAMKRQGLQVLDLEALANHRGSAFGKIGLSKQPSQEHFENLLVDQWRQFDFHQPIWIEDESRLIGQCCIPPSLYQAMAQAPLFYLEIPCQTRLQNLLKAYGEAPAEELIQSTLCIAKRLGGQQTKEIVQLLEQGFTCNAFERLLTYYDKAYIYHLNRRQTIYHMPTDSCSPEEITQQLQKRGQIHEDTK